MADEKPFGSVRVVHNYYSNGAPDRVTELSDVTAASVVDGHLVISSNGGHVAAAFAPGSWVAFHRLRHVGSVGREHE
jgi:hypothetical protein